MKRVVFCWELGGNYGHITGFIGLAQNFKVRGCEVVFVLRNLQYASLLGDGVICVQAPIPNFIPHQRDNYSYTGILASIGYQDKTVLADYVGAWRNLLLELKADLMIADHAPTAILAARTLALPVAIIGTGFVIPPFDSAFPLFIANLPEPDAGLDARVLANINYVMQVFSGEPLVSLGDIFDGAENYLCTFPELDHYGQRTDEDYWGPLFSANSGENYEWPDGASLCVFAYLTPKLKHLAQAVAAIAQLPGHKLVHIPGLTTDQLNAFSIYDLSIATSPVNMDSVLHKADLIISQGGMGMSSLCALAGNRHVILPTQMEQTMLARRLSSMGLAYAASAEASLDDYFAVFSKALGCELLAKNSQLLAQKYQGFSQDEQLEALTEDMLDLLLPSGE